MIGRVSPRQASIRLTIVGPDDETLDLDAVIDTGFTGFVTLPSDAVLALRLPPAGAQQVVLGDGTPVALKLYLARVEWDGDRREVLVLQAGAEVLLGMSLLAGHHMVMDVVDGGEVTIDPLP